MPRKHHFSTCALVEFSLNSKILFHSFFSLVSSVTISHLDGEGNGVDSCGKTGVPRPRSECEEAWPFVRRKAKPFPSPSIAHTHRQSLGSSYVRKQQSLRKEPLEKVFSIALNCKIDIIKRSEETRSFVAIVFNYFEYPPPICCSAI